MMDMGEDNVSVTSNHSSEGESPASAMPIVIAPLSEEEERLLYNDEEEGASTAVSNQEYIDPSLVNYVDDNPAAKREHSTHHNEIGRERTQTSSRGSSTSQYPSYHASRSSISHTTVMQNDSQRGKVINNNSAQYLVISNSPKAAPRETVPSKGTSRFRPIQPNPTPIVTVGPKPINNKHFVKPTLTQSYLQASYRNTSLLGSGRTGYTWVLNNGRYVKVSNSAKIKNLGTPSNKKTVASKSPSLGDILTTRSNSGLDSGQPAQNKSQNHYHKSQNDNRPATNIMTSDSLERQFGKGPSDSGVSNTPNRNHSGNSTCLIKSAKYSPYSVTKVPNIQMNRKATNKQPPIQKVPVMATSVVNFGRATKLVMYPKAVRVDNRPTTNMMTSDSLERQFGKGPNSGEVPAVVKPKSDNIPAVTNTDNDSEVVQNEDECSKVIKNEANDTTESEENQSETVAKIKDEDNDNSINDADPGSHSQMDREEKSFENAGNTGPNSKLTVIVPVSDSNSVQVSKPDKQKKFFCLKCNQVFNSGYEMRLHGIVNISKNAKAGAEQKWVLADGRSVKVCSSLLPQKCDSDTSANGLDSCKEKQEKVKPKPKTPTISKPPETLQCKKCLQVYTTKLKLQKHEWQHRFDKNYKCSIDGCQLEFLTSGRLRLHEKQCRVQKKLSEMEQTFGPNFADNSRVFMCKVPNCNVPPFKTRDEVQNHISSQHKSYVASLVDELMKDKPEVSEESHVDTIKTSNWTSLVTSKSLLENNDAVSDNNVNSEPDSEMADEHVTNEKDGKEGSNAKSLPLESASKHLGELMKHFTEKKGSSKPESNKTNIPRSFDRTFKRRMIEVRTFNRKTLTWSRGSTRSRVWEDRKQEPNYQNHHVVRHFCVKCGTCFSGFQPLRKHLKDQICSETKKCNVCDFSCHFIKELNDHISTHRQQGKSTCPTCQRQFQDIHWLKMHLCPNKPLKSKDCGWYTSSLVDKVTMYSCPYCDYTAKTCERIKRHVLERHEYFSMSSCPHCGFKSYNRNRVEEHCEETHGFSMSGNFIYYLM